MKTLFIPSGPISWASARLRMFWPAEHLPEVEILPDNGEFPREHFEPYDVVVFQKHGVPELQAEWRKQGKRIIWDACDPMWWFSPNDVRAILAECDLVTCSTQALADDLLRWYGQPLEVCIIHDRLKLEHYPRKRVHEDVAPVRLIWYGVSVNRVSLPGAWANLDRMAANGYSFELTICDDRPERPLDFAGPGFPIYYTRWNLERENAVLSAHDIALLPPYPGPWGPLKSNNKELTATACGLPVTSGHDYAELVELVDSPACRQQRSRMASPPQSVDETANEWREVLNHVA